MHRSPELEPYAKDSEQNAAAAPVVAAFAARLAELLDGPARYDAERAPQTRWLANSLGQEDG